MLYRWIAPLAALAACLTASCATPGADAGAAIVPADRVFWGGPVHTGVPDTERAEAVAVRDGRIVYVGDEAGARAFVGPATDTVDLDGHVLFPGFVDAHAHLAGIGERELTLNLDAVASIAELASVIAAEIADAPAGAVVSGRGWIETHWPEDRFPTRDDLDPVSPDNPVVLVRADGHALLANSAALAIAGIDADTPDPDGGQVVRDADGRATGMLIDTAMGLLGAMRAAPTGEALERALTVGAQVYAEAGWTGVHDMAVSAEAAAQIEALAANDRMPLRVYISMARIAGDAMIEEGPTASADGRVTRRAVKLYTDGALGSRGAALLEPYSDASGRGLLLLDEERAAPFFDAALRSGVQLAVHAIGDRANRLTLDWMEAAFAAVPAEERAVADPRWRIEHAQVIDPADLERFAALGVIASMQPSHAIGDLHFAPDRVGLDRLVGAYAWRTLLESGAVIAGGSDAPVERGDPMIEFYAAVVRKDASGFSGPGWRREERVSREQALAMFTTGPAYAAFAEDDLGAIEVGKRADFSVFTADLMSVPEAEILDQTAWMTVVDGEIVYAAAPR